MFQQSPASFFPLKSTIVIKVQKSVDTERLPRTSLSVARMAELVDAPASGAGTRKGVEVRVLFWAPFHF